MQIVTFDPDSFVELDDPLSGERRLVIVASTGSEFLDYIDHDAPPTPLAILDVLNPIQWGDCRAVATALALDGKQERYEAFSTLLLALCDTPAGSDPLTLNRAAKWAYESEDYSVQKAARAGLDATRDARARQLAISEEAAVWVKEGVLP